MSPAHHGRYVAYYRVSTDRQGRTALGIDDQKKKVLDYLDGGKWSLSAAFTEVESGKKGDRPELRKALDYCKKNKGTKLIVATMSRLTPDAKFLLTLLDGSVDVVFADLPQVPAGAQGKFFLTMMVAVAELEAGLTSERTRAALAQVKARGEKRLNPTNLAEAQRKGAESMKAAADAFAARLLPTIRDIQRHGRAVTARDRRDPERPRHPDSPRRNVVGDAQGSNTEKWPEDESQPAAAADQGRGKSED
jgi:DNA invertase Pin-like site-specific DNA recombinase